MSLKIAVMASTMGTDLQAIINEIEAGELDVDLRLVFSNKECYAVERAENAGIKTKVLLFEKDMDTRESYDKKTAQILDTEEVELIVLVGYMRLFSEWFVRKYKNCLLYTSPSPRD